MSSVVLPRRLAAEALGTCALVCTVVGSGIMADKLTDDVAVSLLGNTIPTGAILVVLIAVLGPISGAHFNPAVSIGFTLRRDLPWGEFAPYVLAQIAGGIIGTWAARVMFELDVVQLSQTVRSGSAQWFAEFVVTFGLMAVILRRYKIQE
jgi:glycerol uptake facilitator-like aquaporin